MNQTQHKILKTSLNLFNKHGIDEVSIRDIAGKLNISVGNLNYYYPSKNDIIYALCIDLINKINQLISGVCKTQTGNIFEIAYKQTEAIFATQLEYRFIFNKRYAEVITSLPYVQQYYQKILKIRFDEFAAFQGMLVKEKLARPDLLEDTFSITYIMNILVIFWQQELEIYFPEFTDKQKIQHGLSIFLHAYKPYLTKKGLSLLMPLLKKLEHY